MVGRSEGGVMPQPPPRLVAKRIPGSTWVAVEKASGMFPYRWHARVQGEYKNGEHPNKFVTDIESGVASTRWGARMEGFRAIRKYLRGKRKKQDTFWVYDYPKKERHWRW